MFTYNIVENELCDGCFNLDYEEMQKQAEAAGIKVESKEFQQFLDNFFEEKKQQCVHIYIDYENVKLCKECVTYMLDCFSE